MRTLANHVGDVRGSTLNSPLVFDRQGRDSAQDLAHQEQNPPPAANEADDGENGNESMWEHDSRFSVYNDPQRQDTRIVRGPSQRPSVLYEWNGI